MECNLDHNQLRRQLVFSQEELKQLNDMMETVWRCGQVVSSTAGVSMLNLQAKVQGLMRDGVSNGSDNTGSRIGNDGGFSVDVPQGDEGVSRDVQGGSGE